MLLTLPLVPVFMWLVGRYTERRARERWQALALLSNHFLDVVRGLPTLRAFNRARAQAERIAEVSDEYRADDDGDASRRVPVRRRSSSSPRRSASRSSPSSSACAWPRAASASRPALTVLVLAPELYLPLRNLAAQFHASADGAAVAERLLDLAEPAPARAQRHAPRPIRRSCRSGSRASRSRTRAATSTCCATSISRSSRARRSRSSGRAEAGRARSSRCSCASPSRRPAGSSWATTTSPSSTPAAGAR